MCFGVLKKIISGLKVETDENSSRVPEITNKILLKELVEHFEQATEKLSVRQRILYPMSFNILMHPDDYVQTKESLPFVLPEVIAEFYSSIKKKAKSKGKDVRFDPPATYWFFQFSGCRICDDNGKEKLIERGKIITTGSLTTFDFQKANMATEVNTVLSVKCQNSNVNANNINVKALLGMEILGEGTYKFYFDKNMNENAESIKASEITQIQGFATLRWSEGNATKIFTMIDNYIDISGCDETRTTSNICRINSEAVAVSHVQIRYNANNCIFEIAAYGKTRLNTRELPVSTGANPMWITLPKTNSKIFINDTINVEFNANHDLL